MEPPLCSVYDEMGATYEEHAAIGAYNAHYDRPAVLAALGPVKDLKVLDAACGPGLYAQALIAAGATVTAFDASPAMIALARTRLGDQADIDLAALGEPLPYPDAAFDVGVCALAIHYVTDQTAAFAELHRVIRPGGRLVVSTSHPTIDWLRYQGSYFDRVLETDTWPLATGPQQVRFWRQPLSALCDAATNSGWVIERLLEPQPAASMQAPYPNDYHQLRRDPGFLILSLHKLR